MNSRQTAVEPLWDQTWTSIYGYIGDSVEAWVIWGNFGSRTSYGKPPKKTQDCQNNPIH